MACLLIALLFGERQDMDLVELLQVGMTLETASGGVAALLLTARHQRASGVGQENGPIADPYPRALAQLDSTEAAVRLDAVRMLERLAQGNPYQRQAVVTTLCGYLRTPHQLPDPAPSPDGTETGVSERQVRATAQQVLTDHLRPERGADGVPTNPGFWPDIDLDLTSASLVDFDFGRCEVRGAEFTNATFSGQACFDNATFHGDISFRGATFHHAASFQHAVFVRGVDFRDVESAEPLSLSGARVRVDVEAEVRGNRFWPLGWEIGSAEDDAGGQGNGTDGVWRHLVAVHSDG
ncbi:Pentapeptide repeat-containing protein [Streptoalloteichus tenebrarius]|uniref:Pentapeptide repeat-containing protein n=2 Tax=Streptoalloteichus tenebrarius (strain ATCC 17920 / DSM 40477 / JCM 4838 / CBS 697.72 / NBRC 16177 / NCIMB 11028 / NRRL B-12390 / A12253. 1 / ISP 5477) TaxID=1933 RepID=A0ABT1HMD4_STRSD|nr:Pentapeptide repeat-containing protein [Streptoalloteichus tenebrarius]